MAALLYLLLFFLTVIYFYIQASIMTVSKFKSRYPDWVKSGNRFLNCFIGFWAASSFEAMPVAFGKFCFATEIPCLLVQRKKRYLSVSVLNSWYQYPYQFKCLQCMNHTTYSVFLYKEYRRAMSRDISFFFRLWLTYILILSVLSVPAAVSEGERSLWSSSCCSKTHLVNVPAEPGYAPWKMQPD